MLWSNPKLTTFPAIRLTWSSMGTLLRGQFILLRILPVSQFHNQSLQAPYRVMEQEHTVGNNQTRRVVELTSVKDA